MAGDDAAAKVQVAQLHDLLGYDAVDIGNLADTWRNGPNTPIHVQPYLGVPAEALSSDEERWRWFLQTPGTPVPADRVKALIDAAVPVPAGGVYPGTASHPSSPAGRTLWAAQRVRNSSLRVDSSPTRSCSGNEISPGGAVEPIQPWRRGRASWRSALP